MTSTESSYLLESTAEEIDVTADVTNPTNTFGFSQPQEGSYYKDDWEYNFQLLDSSLAVRDLQANQSNYTPEQDRLFVASDTGLISVGNGSTWDDIEATGVNPTFNTATVSSAPSAANHVVRQADLGTYAADPHGNEAHSSTFITSTDLSGYTEAAVAETISAAWTFNAGLSVSGGLTTDTATVSTAPSASTDALRQQELTDHSGLTDAHHARYTDAEVRAATVSTVTRTTAYSANDREIILSDASGAAFTVTLPAPTSNLDVSIKKIDSTANAVTIATPGTETIDGMTEITLTNQWASRSITSNGTNYFVV